MDKVALITGASGGIGSAICRQLQSHGYCLSLLDVDIDIKDSDTLLTQNCDVTSPEQVESAVSKTIDKFGRIDVLVTCAGRSHLGKIEEIKPEDLDSVYDVNVKGTFNISKAVLPIMKKQKSGYIVHMGSLRAIQHGIGKAAYSMSKSAVGAFSKTLRREVEQWGIKVTVINPGFVDTNIYGGIQVRPYTQSIPGDTLKEAPITQPGDIAKTVLYLVELSEGACVEELNIGKIVGI